MATIWIWLGGAAAYLLLAGQLSADELAAAVILGALGVGWHFAVMHDGAPHFRFEAPAWRSIASALLGLPGATLRVGARLSSALVRPVAGRRVSQPFHRGAADDARDRGRRATAVLTTSFAPDSYAVDLPMGESVIAYHTLTGAAPTPDPRWPA